MPRNSVCLVRFWPLLSLLLAGCTAPVAEPPPEPLHLEPQITAHGIAWASAGEGDPLLLLNGTGSPMSEWDPALLQALSESRRVIVFDYPGLGESTAPAKRSFKGMAAATARLLSDIGVQRTDVLGWSMGGFVTQELLRRHSEQVDRAILVGTNPGGPGTQLGPRWVQRADSDSEGSDRAYLLTNYPRTECAQMRGRAFLRRLTEAVDSGRYPVPRAPARTYRLMVRAEDPWLRSSRNVRDLADVQERVLVIVGDHDVITPPANSRTLFRAIPGSALIVVPGAGHSVLFQAPAESADVISAFVDGTVPPEPEWPCSGAEWGPGAD